MVLTIPFRVNLVLIVALVCGCGPDTIEVQPTPVEVPPAEITVVVDTSEIAEKIEDHEVVVVIEREDGPTPTPENYKPCVIDEDCEDGNKCTHDVCEGGMCYKMPALPDFSELLGAPNPCDDDNACTEDICNINTGQCEYGNPCSDYHDGCVEDWVDPDVVEFVCYVDDCSEYIGSNCLGPDAIGVCMNGECVAPTLMPTCSVDEDCEDGDDCTLDVCQADRSCGYGADKEAGCCLQNADCDDGDPCTVDVCAGETCDHLSGGCCTDDLGCDDGDPCTVDTCHGGTCAFQPPTGACCRGDEDCDDGDPCTRDSCVGGRCMSGTFDQCCSSAAECTGGSLCSTASCVDSVCVYQPVVGCCSADTDCFDADGCTLDVCNEGTCANPVKPNCCIHEGQCPPRPCHSPSCVSQICVYAPVPGCCLSNKDCDDSNACTRDICREQRCSRQVSQLEGCCQSSSSCAPSPCREAECLSHHCVFSEARPGCCATDADCDDGDPCTANRCLEGNCLDEVFTGAGCGDGAAFFEDFDGPLLGWSFVALVDETSHVRWQRSATRSTSPPSSLWFGNSESGTYAGGDFPVGGAATSRQVTLPEAARLSFALFKDTETVTTQRDVVTVELVTNDAVNRLWSSSPDGADIGSTGGSFVTFTVDLSAFGGTAGRIRFRFESVDEQANAFEGVYVDDVRLE